MSHTRFLCVALAVATVSSLAVAASKNAARPQVGGNWALTLDGASCGMLRQVEGGAISAEVINETNSAGPFVKKHIGQPKYEDYTVAVGFGMGKSVYDWIAQSWAGQCPRKNGSVVALSYDMQPTSERQFLEALLTAVTIPAMDGASKEPGYITLTLSPQVTRVVKPAGKPGDYAEGGKTEQKMWVPASFRLEIAGLDCSRVSKIDSFTVKQPTVTMSTGDARDQTREPGKLEFPNLRLTLPEANAQPFQEWHERFVLEGNNDDSQEKSGSLTLLSLSRQVELVRIRFFNLGIIRVQPNAANADSIRRVVVELYVEQMEFEYLNKPAGAEAPGTAPAKPMPRRG